LQSTIFAIAAVRAQEGDVEIAVYESFEIFSYSRVKLFDLKTGFEQGCFRPFGREK
jgi:hypothetical protein